MKNEPQYQGHSEGKNSKSVLVDIESRKALNINPNLAPDEHESLITLLKKIRGHLPQSTQT